MRTINGTILRSISTVQNTDKGGKIKFFQGEMSQWQKRPTSREKRLFIEKERKGRRNDRQEQPPHPNKGRKNQTIMKVDNQHTSFSSCSSNNNNSTKKKKKATVTFEHHNNNNNNNNRMQNSPSRSLRSISGVGGGGSSSYKTK